MDKLARAIRFAATIRGCTREQARQVIAERISYDEDYGFDYEIDYENNWKDDE